MKQLEIITYGTATIESLSAEEKTAFYNAMLKRILSLCEENKKEIKK
jgi:hypothetical protein